MLRFLFYFANLSFLLFPKNLCSYKLTRDLLHAYNGKFLLDSRQRIHFNQASESVCCLYKGAVKLHSLQECNVYVTSTFMALHKF